MCACMEATAELFLADGLEPAAGADLTADPGVEQQTQHGGSSRVGQIEEID